MSESVPIYDVVLLRYCVDEFAIALIVQRFDGGDSKICKKRGRARWDFWSDNNFFNRRPSQILVFILPWDPRMVFRSGTSGFNRNALSLHHDRYDTVLHGI